MTGENTIIYLKTYRLAFYVNLGRQRQMLIAQC